MLPENINPFLLGAIVCLIVFIVTYMYFRRIILDDMIGFYVMPDSFASQAGLESLTLVLSDISWNTVSGFIIINDVSIGIDIKIPLFATKLIEVPVSLSYDTPGVPLPEECLLTVSHGHLLLEDDETIFVAAEWVPVF